MKDMKFCPRFYEYLHIDNNQGDVIICPWMQHSKGFIGNLLTDEIDKIYNSANAHEIRSTMDDQTFQYCRREACPFIQNNSLEDITPEEYEHRKQTSYFPNVINLAYDFVCNQACETCRKVIFTPPSGYAEQMRTIYEKIAPHLDKMKQITASGHGDPFASPYMMEVLENLRPTNPDLNILLETNGVFFDEAHWERIKHLSGFHLNIIVTVNSFHAFTYKHISRGGNYEKVMHNLDFVSQLRKNQDIAILSNSFVIQDRNFREIPSFIKHSFDDYAFDSVVLKPVYQWKMMTDEDYWFKDVLNPCHPYHPEYLEILQDPMLKDPRVYHFGGNMLHKPRPYPAHEQAYRKFEVNSII